MRPFVLASAIAAAAALALPAFAQTPILPDATVLDVRATGRVVRTPDLATIRAGVVTQAPTAAAAASDNAARMAKVIAALRRNGLAERDLSTSSLTLSPQYRFAENQPPVVTGYQASNSVAIRFREVKRAGPILDTLVEMGANQIDGPTLTLDKPDEATDAARADAITKARARAELYARSVGMRVERIVHIDEGGDGAGATPPRPMYRMQAAAADSAPTEVLPGETEVTVDLSVRFVLK